MSRDFKVGRNVSCEESTVSPVWATRLIYFLASSPELPLGYKIFTRMKIFLLSGCLSRCPTGSVSAPKKYYLSKPAKQVWY